MVLKQRPQDLVLLCLSALFLQPFFSLGEKTYLSNTAEKTIPLSWSLTRGRQSMA